MAENDDTQAEQGSATEPDEQASQPDLGDAGKRALQEERRKAREASKALAEAQARLKEIEDRDKSEAEKTAERLSAAEQRAAKAELNALKLDIAAEKAPKGMPFAQVRKLAGRLNGATREDLEADADDLFGDIPAVAAGADRKAPKPDLSQGARGGKPLSGAEAGRAEAQKRFGTKPTVT